MEKMMYRDTIAWLDELFEGKKLLTVSDVSRVFKIDRATAKNRYPFKNNFIEITRLAALLCVTPQDIRSAYGLKL